MSKVLYHPEASLDFEEAYAWYFKQSERAAAGFADEVEAATERIMAAPLQWARVDRLHHRCLLHRYPYSIVYRIENDSIQIIAIAHAKRRPGYWKARLN